MRRALPILLFFSLCRLVFGQVADRKPEFEVASVKPVTGLPRPAAKGERAGTAQIEYSGATLKRLIRIAYQVADYQVIGPSWITNDRYDVFAKLPEGERQERAPLMLQSLLADRFKLELHRETRDLPTLALVAARGGPKMKRAISHEDFLVSLPLGRRILTGKMDMSELVSALSIPGTDAAITGRPIIDLTGLSGLFEIKMEWSPDAPASPDGAASTPNGGPSIFTAIQEQLGLKLEARKTPTEVLVVDRAQKIPTGN